MKTKNVRIETADEKELARQYRANVITDGLEGCKLLVEKIGEEIGAQHRDQKIFCYLGDLTNIVALLIDASRRSNDRAQDHEDRLEKLEKQMEELKKRRPVDDGK